MSSTKITKHQKHKNLVRPAQGIFARKEVAILGSTCEKIKTLASSIAEYSGQKLSVAYIDTEHVTKDETIDPLSDSFFKGEFTDKISHYEIKVFPKTSDLEKAIFFSQIGLALVNGNHESASSQIVIIDPGKEASLIKRSAQLTNVIALISLANFEIPTYIKQLLPNWNDLPLYSISDKTGLASFVRDFVLKDTPPLMGLVLAGGYSKRMGEDKISINYRGLPQYEYLGNLLRNCCKEVFISCRQDQEKGFINSLIDTFSNLGAYGGILSAMRENPNVAWLTVACDMPFLDQNTIELLVKQRDPNKIATCFYNAETNFPEPLLTIWEPKAYPILLLYLSRGVSCPRKVLINSDINLIKLEDELPLINANSPEDQAWAKAQLAQ